MEKVDGGECVRIIRPYQPGWANHAGAETLEGGPGGRDDGLTLDTVGTGRGAGAGGTQKVRNDDGLAIGLIRGSAGWIRREKGRVWYQSYCTLSIRSRTGTDMIASVGSRGNKQVQHQGSHRSCYLPGQDDVSQSTEAATSRRQFNH